MATREDGETDGKYEEKNGEQTRDAELCFDR